MLGLNVPYQSQLTAESSSVDLSVAIESVRLRASQTVHTGLIVVPIAPIIGLLFAWAGAGMPAIIWGVSVCLGTALNYWFCRRAKETSRTAGAERIGELETKLWWLTILNTFAMGLGIWWMDLGGASVKALYAATLVQCLYSLGALVNASTHPPTFIAGTVVNLGSLVLFWLMQGIDGLPQALTLCALIFLVSRFSHQIYDEFVRSVKIRFENADLLKQVRAQVTVTDAARTAAEEANQAKSRFLAGASHDLRQPLHSLLLFTSLLEKASPDKRDEFMRHIHTAADTLDRLFSSLLDLSKLDSGFVSKSISAVNLEPVLSNILSAYQPIAAERGIKLSVEVSPVVAQTDGFLIERIIRNLVDNAIKYTDKGSVVVKVEAEAELIVVSVEDTGFGIPADQIDHIFDEFHRIREPEGGGAPGSGLGLAIVARLCQLLEHPIEVSSTPGSGSQFKVTLPIGELGDTTVPGASGLGKIIDDVERHLDGLDIIIVDDDKSICQAMSAVVESMAANPITFTSFESLEEALDEKAIVSPAAVISDYRLAGPETGVDVVRRLHDVFGPIPAVLISGDLRTEPAGIESLSGVSLLHKPVGENTIKQWLQKSISAGKSVQATD